MDRNYINDKLATASQKVAQYRDRLYVPGQRDDGTGFEFSAKRILDSYKNLLFSNATGDSYDAVDSIFKGFSQAPGMNDVENVKAVDAVDISIMATMQSIIPYLAAERAMSRPSDVIYYQKLVNTNVAGGFKTIGNDVVNPFKPLSNLINLGMSGASSSKTIAAEVDFGSPIAKRSVVVSATIGDKTVVGRDKDGDGIIYWSASGIANSGTVDYATGKITFDTISAADAKVTVDLDRTSQTDGANTLKTKSVTEKVMVDSKVNRIILEQSFEDTAYMNKMSYDLQAVGVSQDYSKRALRQLLDSYVHYIDLTVVRSTVEAAGKDKVSADATFDLTKYSLASSQASTKNDKLNEFMLELDTALLKQSGRGTTAYLVDSDAARILANNPMNFTANTNFNQYINGVIGTYKNVPVIRHNALDGIAGTGVAYVAAVHKTADGQAAPSVYAEYLPPYSVRPALNFNNPAQFSTGLFSQTATEVIVKELAVYGTIKFAGSSSSSND